MPQHKPEPYHEPYMDTAVARLLPEEGELVMDLDELAYRMGAIALGAQTVGLPQLEYGVHGYREVTVACTNRPGDFRYPDKIMRTMPVFFDQFAGALRHHVRGERHKVGAWSTAFYSPAAQAAPPSEAMVDFLTMHVRYDLPKTLELTDTEPKHKWDYTVAVNRILTDVGEELLEDYVEVPKVLRKLGADRVGLRLALWELFGARNEAWMSFEELQRAQDPADYAQIRQNQERRAVRRLLSSNAAADFIIRTMTRTPKGVWSSDRQAA